MLLGRGFGGGTGSQPGCSCSGPFWWGALFFGMFFGLLPDRFRTSTNHRKRSQNGGQGTIWTGSLKRKRFTIDAYLFLMCFLMLGPCVYCFFIVELHVAVFGGEREKQQKCSPNILEHGGINHHKTFRKDAPKWRPHFGCLFYGFS